MSDQEWDVALAETGSTHSSMQVTVPADIARPLRERGYNRAKLTLSAEGIVLRPYAGKAKRGGADAEIPDWGNV